MQNDPEGQAYGAGKITIYNEQITNNIQYQNYNDQNKLL